MANKGVTKLQYFGAVVVLLLLASLFIIVTAPLEYEKLTMLCFFAGGGLLVFVGKRLKNPRMHSLSVFSGVFVLLTTLLMWNYLFTTMEPANSAFGLFQNDSESYVRDTLRAITEGRGPETFGLLMHTGEEYAAQLGLHGWAFSLLLNFFSYGQSIYLLHMFCAMLTAAVFVLLCMLIYRKYNLLMAGCFFACFWLGQWVVNFARNLYWIEFSWFVPMLFGLFVSIYGDDRCCRYLGYAGVLVSVILKCMCGYEYITCIMMAMIAFPLVDWVSALRRGEKKRARTLFVRAFVLGALALLAFVLTLLIHALVRGGGDLMQGLDLIYRNDVLRRASMNADAALFDAVYTESLEISPIKVLENYFSFPTDIIVGLPGSLFTLLSVLPGIIFVYRGLKKQLDLSEVVLYLFFFLTSASWFVLAAPHSQTHYHMNYVLWYFGHIQLCMYFVLRQGREFLQQRSEK